MSVRPRPEERVDLCHVPEIWKYDTAEPVRFLRNDHPDLLPPLAGGKLQRAYPSLFLCDFSVAVTLEEARKALQDKDITVDWLRIVPRPRFILAWDKEEIFAPNHSCLLVTDRADRSQFTNDFTLQ
ncbi:hypothetical protein BDV95DRAFT_601720 [Massariosphaeria phaeospora]|uniref:Uncharacterized protein n=1 Tax=Massariosphaeria phaeospora TaxID=100035 RepID=A0A7C8ILL9_9PLEO|nr:hypothetical protein BDV95DRAFT_601720 [Massariosphaeria phaeospora]